MTSQYRYVSKKDLTATNFTKALKAIESDGLVIDSKHLPLVEAAESGNMLAIYELTIAFAEGTIKGIPQNYSVAKTYMNIISEINEEFRDYKCLVESVKNTGLLERNFGNIKSAQEKFTKAIQIMVNNLPPQEWDYEIHYLLESIL